MNTSPPLFKSILPTISFATLPLAAKVIPVDLPPPDAKPRGCP